jgi:hypothetical protein
MRQSLFTHIGVLFDAERSARKVEERSARKYSAPFEFVEMWTSYSPALVAGLFFVRPAGRIHLEV